ncbi:MAG TPA: hypothetical protein VEN99_06055, partial [Acidimicrobiia bacterium]|nr:hypothetical protein [Acidimicrobiia bacterium]
QVALSTVSGPHGPSGFATATATCPAGTSLTGGGAETIPGNLGDPSGQPSPLHLNGSYPSDASGVQVGSGPDAGSWSAAAEEGADVGAGTSTTAFAICGTTSLALQVAAVTVAGPFGSGGMVTPTASCPAGTVVFGGGAFTQPPSNSVQPSPLHLGGTFPSDAAGNPLPGGSANPATWAGSAREAGDVGNPPGTGTKTASFALCAQAPGAGSVLGTGYNGYGQLCNGSTTGAATASGAAPPLDAGVIAVSAGTVHSMALTSAGAVSTCGRNNFGQLGNGTTTDSSTPVAVTLPGGATATAIAASEYHSLALSSGGTVYAWGHNAFGQLGNGTTTDSSTPVAVAVPGTVTRIAAGWAFDLALTSTGAVYAWGFNGDGELGTTSSDTCATFACSKTPVAVSLGGATVKAIAAGWDHSLAIRSDDTPLAWGLNNYGQLGVGDTTNRLVPAPALGGIAVAAIACGGIHSLAIKKSDSTGLAWGRNNDGQLGVGTTEAFLPNPTPLASSAALTAIAAGAFHSLALRSGGAPLAWGYNATGQLGDATTTNRFGPVSPLAPADANVTALAAGWAHSLFVR